MKKAVLEGLLFVVGEEGLTFEQIQDVLQIDEEESKRDCNSYSYISDNCLSGCFPAFLLIEQYGF